MRRKILGVRRKGGQEPMREGSGELDREFVGQSPKAQNMRSVTLDRFFQSLYLMERHRTYCVLTIINGSPLPLQNIRGS